MDYILLILLAIIITALIFVLKQLYEYGTIIVAQHKEYTTLLNESVMNIKNSNFEYMQQLRKINLIQNQPVISTKTAENYYCSETDSDTENEFSMNSKGNASVIQCTLTDLCSNELNFKQPQIAGKFGTNIVVEDKESNNESNTATEKSHISCINEPKIEVVEN